MTTHAKLSPSSSNEWLNCKRNAYYRYYNYKGTEYTNIQAQIGTNKHKILEEELRSGTYTRHKDVWNDNELRTINELKEMLTNYKQEMKVFIPLHINNTCYLTYGTIDIIDKKDNHINIIDFKFGKIPVKPNCSQMFTYTRGVYYAVSKETRHLYTYSSIIVQPTDTVKIKTHTWDTTELNKFINIEIGQNGSIPKPTYGRHCYYCKFKQKCYNENNKNKATDLQDKATNILLDKNNI